MSSSKPRVSMASAPVRMVALLRGVNVGGKRRVPMAELRAVAEDLGLAEVATYIQSGNLVFTTPESVAQVTIALEARLSRTFGFDIELVVRTGDAWAKAVATCPYPEAAAARPHLLHLGVSRVTPPRGVVEALRPYCSARESATLVGDVLWIDFADGVARSKLTTAVLDRAVGGTVTARNWKSVQKIAAMLA